MTPGDKKDIPPLTLESLKLFEQVLNMQTMEVKAGDFEETALKVIKAKAEIKSAIEVYTQDEAEAASKES